MESQNASPDVEFQIRTLVDDRVRAVRQRDLAGALRPNASDIVTYDVLPPLRNVGAEGVRERAKRWLDGYSEGPNYEVRDLRLATDENVAFAHYLYRVSGTLANGGDVKMWVRCTLGFRKVNGEWRIVHEHDSVPFDPESGRAVLDLQP